MLLLLFACAEPAEPRAGEYFVDDGSYMAREPSGEARGTLLWFHGYNSNAARFYNNTILADEADAAGLLLVFPEGLNESWDSDNSPGAEGGRDEMAFIDQVLDDVDARFGLVEPVTTGGVSHGSSLPYQLLCESDRVQMANTIMGTFWEPVPVQCDAGPKDLRHIHGLADTTWPYDEGRDFWGDTKQGTVPEVMSMWRDHMDCEPDSVPIDEGWDAECEVWDCGEHEVRLCLHPGGHTKPSGWIGRLMSWIQERS